MGKLQLAGRMRGMLRTLVPANLKIAHSYNGEFPTVEQNGLTARCHRDWPQETAFLDQWKALLARNPQMTPFCSPAWQSSVLDEFVPAGKFRLLTVHRGDDLLAILPLSFNTASMLETAGRWVTDYMEPLVDAACAEECWAIMLQQLVNLWDWSVGGIILHHIRHDSPLRTLLPPVAAKYGFTFEESVVDVNPMIALPATWDEYLARLDGHERKEVKRKIRNAQTKSNARWLTLTKIEEVETAMERALSALRQSDSFKADFCEEILIPFLRRLIPKLTKAGDFYINELWLEEQPAAWLFALRSNQGPMIYNTSYDFSKRNLSPGAVAFALAIQDAINAGYPCFNLLRGGEEYKKRLEAVDAQLLRFTLKPK